MYKCTKAKFKPDQRINQSCAEHSDAVCHRPLDAEVGAIEIELLLHVLAEYITRCIHIRINNIMVIVQPSGQSQTKHAEKQSGAEKWTAECV